MKPNNDPLTDQNYMEVVDRSFNDVANKAVSSTTPTTKLMDGDFQQNSINFWLGYKGGKYFPVYNEGAMSGTFNARQPSFRSISDTYMESMKNILRIQCENEDKTSESFTTYIQLLETGFKLLAEKMEDVLDTQINGELFMAYLHATFNAFIVTNIQTKEGK